MLTIRTFVFQWFWDNGFLTKLPRRFSFSWRQRHASLTFWLWMRFMTLDKSPLKFVKCEHTKNGFVQIGILVRTSWPILRPRNSNSNVNVIRDHLKFIKENHTFRFGPCLFNLDVCSSIFTCWRRQLDYPRIWKCSNG
jgi:hypothetical protein